MSLPSLDTPDWPTAMPHLRRMARALAWRWNLPHLEEAEGEALLWAADAHSRWDASRGAWGP